MPKVLTMHRKIVPPPERKKYMERLRAKRDYYGRANCRFWACEETGLQGAFLEFFEAPDAPPEGEHAEFALTTARLRETAVRGTGVELPPAPALTTRIPLRAT